MELLAGIDEAGRGPWAGPVVAAAVIFHPERPIPEGLDDSKRLSRKTRDYLFDIIRTNAMAYAIGVASAQEIDTHNILQATFLAMRRAVDGLSTRPSRLAIDGNRLPPALPFPAEAIIGGDGLVPAISAASILAKVTRDRMMETLDSHYPGYGFAKHAGYGTRQHQEAIARLGITPEHRRSFAPIRACLKEREIA